MVMVEDSETDMQAVTRAELTDWPADRFRAGDRRMLEAGSVPGFPTLLPGNIQCSYGDGRFVVLKTE
jgi:hypothetical protein